MHFLHHYGLPICHKQVSRKDVVNLLPHSADKQTTSSFIAVSSNTQYM